MSPRSVAIVVATVLGAGCGGGTHVVRLPDDVSCDAVADHLVVLAEQGNRADAPAGLSGGIREEARRQCIETPWTAERRDCLAAATDQEATLACPSQ